MTLFGADALAAVAVGSDLYLILFYLGAGVLGGLAPFYTAATVRSYPTQRARLERIGFVTVVLLATLLVPVVWSAPDWLGVLGLDCALLDAGRGYTRAMALTLIPMLGVALFRTILTATQKPKIFLKVTLAMLPLNAAGNYVLMTGAGPVPAFGPAGAGLASLGVATAILAILALVARRSGSDRAGVPLAASFDLRGLASVVRVGLPMGIATVAEVGVFLGATITQRPSALRTSRRHACAPNRGVAYAVPTALLQAAMVRMARADTLGDRATRRAVTASGLGLSLVLGASLCLALALGAQPIAHGFFDETAGGIAAAGIATGRLPLLGFMEFLAGLGSTAAGRLRGRKDTRAPMLFTLVGHWAIGAPIGVYLSAAGIGIAGVWIGPRANRPMPRSLLRSGRSPTFSRTFSSATATAESAPNSPIVATSSMPRRSAG